MILPENIFFDIFKQVLVTRFRFLTHMHKNEWNRLRKNMKLFLNERVLLETVYRLHIFDVNNQEMIEFAQRTHFERRIQQIVSSLWIDIQVYILNDRF